jgi:hypothetical protein
MCRLLLRPATDIGDCFAERLHSGCIRVFKSEKDSRDRFFPIASKQLNGMRKQGFAAREMAAFDLFLHKGLEIPVELNHRKPS